MTAAKNKPLPDDLQNIPNSAQPPAKEDCFNWPPIDEPGTFRLVHKNDLQIDHAYQRSNVSNARVLRIAKNWSWRSCGVLLTAERPDGSLWVYDGQHRLLAARKRASISLLPCLTFPVEAHDKVEEATAFVQTNTMRLNVHSYNLYIANIERGESTALAIRSLVSQHGYRIAPDASGHHTVACVSTLSSSYKFDPNITSRVWGLCVNIADNSLPVPGNMFSALFHLECFVTNKKIQSITEGGCSQRLKEAGVNGCQSAMQRRAIEMGKGGPKVAADGIVRDIINKGRRRGDRIPRLFTDE